MTATSEEQFLATMYGQPLRPQWSAETATTMSIEGVDPPDQRSEHTVNVLVFPVPFAGVSRQRSPVLRSGAVAVEVEVDEVGLPGECMASTAQWPTLWAEPRAEPPRARGTLSVRMARSVLFTLNVELGRTSANPWKPKVTIDRRALDRADDA